MVAAPRKPTAGMTLVEIMVTLLISSIIAASTFMFFAGQQRIYDTQTKVLNIQQNLWAAMEVLARYTRAAGGGMYECVQPASYANSAVPNGSRLLSANASVGPLAADMTDANRPATGVRAYQQIPSGMQWIPPLWIVNNATAADAALNVVRNTDILTVAFGNRTSGTDVDATLAANFADASQGTALSLIGVNSGDMFRQWEFVLLLVTPSWAYGMNPATNRGCTLFQVTNDPRGAATLAHASVARNLGDVIWNPPGNIAGMLPGGGYTANSAGVRNFGSLIWVTFFIQQTGNGPPNLMMQQRHLGGDSGKPQVLAEGIEELQVSFACDTGILTGADLTNLNGQLDEGTNDATRRNDEWWNNVPNDGLPPQGSPGFCNLPTAVRITLVARTLSPDDLIQTSSGNGPMDIEDHCYSAPCCRSTSTCNPAGRPTDQFRRRVMTTTVYPRNNKPL